MVDKIISYISRDLLQEYIENPQREDVTGKALEGTLMMIDISSFTPMMEQLAEYGGEGTEEASRLLNSIFTSILKILHDNGGYALKFSGDAVLCLFRGVPRDARKASRLQSMQASILIMGSMKQYQNIKTLAGELSFGVSIGVHSGRFLDFVVGSESRRERIQTGTVLEDMVRAQSFAQAGEIIITEEALKYISDYVRTETTEKKRYFHLLGLSESVVIKMPRRKESDASRLDLSRLKPFVPQKVYEKILAEPDDLLMTGEHRRSTVIFLNFCNLNRELQAFDRYFNQVVSIVHKYEGTLAKVDNHIVGDRMMILFGALTSHEDDEERAGNCAWDIMHLLPAMFPGLLQRMGIASGNVFAGNIGSFSRREYTTIGSIVNLAARLMSSAPFNSILISESFFKAIKKSFYTDGLGERKYKGFPQTQMTYQLRDRRGVPQFIFERKPMVGREKEMNKIKTAVLNTAENKELSVISISGEAGIGKSRLMKETVSFAIKNGYRAIIGNCISYGESIAYHPFREMLREILAIVPLNAGQVIEEKISAKLAMIGMERWSPIIVQIMGLEVEDNEFTVGLGAEHKKSIAFEIIGKLIAGLSEDEPMLIVIDDLHWVDKASKELLLYLFGKLTSKAVFFLLVFRPEFPDDELQNLPGYLHIKLNPLPRENIQPLIKSRIAVQDIPEDLIHILEERTKGNPFYIEEILNLMIERGHLALDKNANALKPVGDWANTEIPTSVTDIILSRIDTLKEEEKNVLKVASVLGRIFLLSILDAVQRVRNGERLKTTMVQFECFDITLIHKTIPELEYMFKHIITQEVVYSMISYAARRQLHNQVGSFIESQALSPAEQYETLAHHFLNAQNWQKGYEYALKSAEKNAKVYSCHEALTHYQRALDCLEKFRQLGELPEEEYNSRCFQIFLGRDKLLEVLGRREEHKENLQQLEKMAQLINTPYALAVAYNRLSGFYTLLHELEKGMEYAQKAMDIAKDEELARERCRALLNLGTALWYSQKYDSALEAYNRGLPITQEKELCDLHTELLENVGTVLMTKGEFKESLESFQKALELLQTKHYDSLSEIRILGKLGAVYGNLQDYDKALDYLEKQYNKASIISAKMEMAQGIYNIAIFNLVTTRFEQAMQAFQKSLALSEEIKFLRGILLSKHNLGSLLAYLGQFDKAKHLLDEVQKTAEEQNMTEIVIKNLLSLSIIHHSLGEYEQAFDFTLKAYNLAQQLGSIQYKASALFGCALQMEEMEKYDNAETYIREGVELAENINMHIEQAEFHILAAKIQRKKGRLEDALETIKKAQAAIPAKTPFPELYYELFGIYKTMVKEEEARQAITSAYKIIANIASGVEDEELRRSYLDKVPLNQKIIMAYNSPK